MGQLPPISGHQVMAVYGHMTGVSLALSRLLPAPPADLTLAVSSAMEGAMPIAHDQQHSPSFVRVEKALPQSCAPPKAVSPKSGPDSRSRQIRMKKTCRKQGGCHQYRETHPHARRCRPFGTSWRSRECGHGGSRTLGLLMCMGKVECCQSWPLHQPWLLSPTGWCPGCKAAAWPDAKSSAATRGRVRMPQRNPSKGEYKPRRQE